MFYFHMHRQSLDWFQSASAHGIVFFIQNSLSQIENLLKISKF